MALQNEIVLITPQERVLRALETTASLSMQAGALGLLYTVSPLALLMGSLGMLALCWQNRSASQKRDSYWKTTAQNTKESGDHQQEQGFLDMLSTLHGNKPPSLVTNHSITVVLALRQAAGYTMRPTNNNYIAIGQFSTNRISRLWTLAHEFAHVARNDTAAPHLAFGTAGMGMVAGEAVTFALGLTIFPHLLMPALAGATALAAASTLPAAIRLLTDWQTKKAAAAGKDVPVPPYELECERITCQMLGGHFSRSPLADNNKLAQHSRDMGLALPALPEAGSLREPGPLRRGFNRLCAMLCKPVTMPFILPANADDNAYAALMTMKRNAGTDPAPL